MRSLIVVVALLAVVLVGCSKKEDNTIKLTAPDGQTATVEVK